MKAAEIKPYLEEKYVFLSGAIDKKGYLIISFPCSAAIEKLSGEELKKLLIYLASINSSSNGDPRFTFIVDMRQRTWENCKHIFKVLQEQFPYKIEHVYIVKPDGFWDKHKISLGMSKYTFEHSVQSLESLTYTIDRNQLTPDLNGTFQYNHIRWLDFRLSLEAFVYNSKETLHAYELLYNELQQADVSNNVARAQDAIETHMTVFKDQLSRVNIEPLINDGQHLLNMLKGTGSDSENVMIKTLQQRTYPLDYFDEARKISLVMDNLRSAKERCFQLWHQKKNRLEQNLQLKLFEQDCDRLCSWIGSSRAILGPKYTDIGSSCSEAMQLLAEHEQFAKVCLNNETVIRRTQNVGDRLISSGHYATGAIKSQMNRLNNEWESLTRLLDNRTNILTASLQFHQKADEYLVQVSTWKHLCSLTDDLTAIESMEHLERLLQQHFNLSENISRIYAQICNDGKAIIDSVAPSQQTTNEYQFDFRAGAKHILEIVQEILVNHRYLDAKWNQRKAYLQQRLSFVAFANDVQQILDWIEKHGDAFLQKNLAVGIGKSLRQAKKLDKMHTDFEMAIKNTKTNAENLIAAADNMYNEQIQQQKLAQTNNTNQNAEEENADKQLNQGRAKIYQLAHDLERRMREFDERVARRRYILDINLNFHTHCEEYSDWLTQVELVWSTTGGDDDDHVMIAANCEEMLEALIEQREGAIEACATIEQEGQILLDYLTEVQSTITPNDTTPSPQFTNLLALIESIRKKTNDLDAIWEKRRLRVELFVQIKHFEIYSREVSHLLDIWSHELVKMQQQQQQQQQQSANSVSSAIIPPALPLALQTLINGTTTTTRHRSHHHSSDRATGKVDDWAQVQEHIHTRVAQVVQRGRDLLSLMEKSPDFKVILEQQSSANNESSSTVNAPQQQSLLPSPDQICNLLLVMNDREQKLSELATQQQKLILWRVQFVRLERDWNDIKIMINNFEAKLASNLTLAISLTDAEKFHRDHEDIKPFVDRICERIDTLQRKTEKLSTLISNNDASSGPSELVNTLVSARQKVQLQFEDRLRLINAQIIFYKSSEQVSQMLDTLEREYRTIEDIHEKLKSYTDDEIQKILADRLEQLDENKHSFLRACTVARQKSDLFHKYALRNAANLIKPEAYLKPLEQKIKNVSTILKNKEDTVLNAWHHRKKIIDEYLQYISFKRNTDKVFVWIDEHDECFVSKLEALDINDDGYMDFVRALKEKKTMVRKLVERADVLVERSHSFAPLIKDTCNRLDSGFNSFFQKIMRINNKEEIDKEAGRKSDSSLEEKLEQQELNEGKRKAAKQRELIFNELLNTERAYVDSLSKCIQYYLGEMRQHVEEVPEFLRNKESILFLNIEEIQNFHKNLFLKDLERYEDCPEDVGHCFVTWAKQFHIFYVEYCKNNESCIKVLTQYRGPYFETIQHKYQIDTINSYLIKPVQRITKYELLLQRLMSCCEESKGEVKEGYDLMCSVPKKANDAMHLSYLEELEAGLTKEALGDVLLQNTFQIWDSKQIIKKGKERHVFLFETSIVIAKILKPVARGAVRYIYKYKLMTAEIFDVKEHLEAGEPCKFALYTGRPMSSHTADLRVTLKANDLSTKQQWVIRIRELIQENDLYHDLSMHETNTKQTSIQNKISQLINNNQSDRRSQEIADNVSDEFEHINRGGSLSSMTTGSFSSSSQYHQMQQTTTEEEKHTENTVRKWYNNNDDDDDDDASNQSESQPTKQLPNATIVNKIERVLRKINAWTNETASTSTNNSDNNIQRETLQDTSFNETNLSAYDDAHHKQKYKSRSKKATSHKSLDSIRQRCCSSTYAEPNIIKNQQIPTHRPYSMTFANEPLSSMKINDNMNYTCEGFDRKKKKPDSKVQFSSFRQKQSFGKHPVLINLLDNNKTQRRSLYYPHTNLAPLSSMYGSDFFYPPTTTREEIEQQQQQHEYDNLTFPQNLPHHYYDPFPILVDCQHCNRTIDRSTVRDISCQVPSDEDEDQKNNYQDVQDEHQKTKRSSPIYESPRSSPPLCQPPMAMNLLAPYHFRRKRSLSSYASLHSRSKSAPSAASSIVSSNSSRSKHFHEKKNNNNNNRLQPLLSPLQTVTTVPSLVPETAPVSATPSTTALLRSIKTSIHAMKKRLKDIRRLSEDSNVTTVLDNYTARSSQELSVSKGQHVRVVQRQPPNAPDWCLIRLLNDQHNPSNPSSLATSSTTITAGSFDLSSPPPSSSSSKYIEGLVPAAILKATKSSASNIHPVPPLALSTSTNISEQDAILNNTDDSQNRQQQSAAVHFSKRKASFRRILKNPVRRLSLKDNSSSSKDVKSPTSRDLIAASTSIISTDSADGISSNNSNNKKQSISLNSTTSSAAASKIKAFTFANSEDLTLFPDDTNSASKFMDGTSGTNGVFKLTGSSSPSSAITIVSPSATLTGDDLENDVIEVPPPMDIQAQPKLSADANVDKVTTDETSPLAPINIAAGLSTSDFHIPGALSVITPAVNDASTTSSSVPSSNILQQYPSTIPTSSSSLSSSPSSTRTRTNTDSLLPSSSTTTMISNDNLNEQTDEISLHDIDTNIDSSLTVQSSVATNDEPVDDRTKYGEKRRHNIVELIETEKEYVKDLALIVEGYMNVLENDKDIKKPAGLVGLERVVFGNVQRIYEFHRDTFLPQLEQCIENPDILGRLFTTNRFSPYVRYCENKPRSEYIVSEYHDYFEEIRKKLGQKLLVSDLLIKPVQRIMRYQLLLKEILKSTERMHDEPRAIRSALQVMIEVPRLANDMMNVGRIKDLPTNVHQLGELKLQDMLSVSEPISKETKDAKEAEKKLKERRVFLFQQAMVFSEELPAKDKYSSPNYIYKYDLKINKLQHKEFKRNKESFQFTLVEVDAGVTRRVVCQCKDDEQYELWVTNVEKVLQRQMDLIIALTNPTAALQKDPRSKQDSSTSLFIPNLSTPTTRNQIKKSMSDRPNKSSESLSPTHLLSPSPKLPTPLLSSSRTSSNSDTSPTPTTENSNKKSSFNLFDSILQRSITKPLTINTSTHHDVAQSKKLGTPLSSSTSMSNTQLPEQARCLHSYNAIKEDEICVHKGEYVQIVAANQDNRWFVHRDANRTSPAAEGWIPGFVLGLKNPNSTLHATLSSSSPVSSSSSSSSQQHPSSSLSANSLHRLTTTTTPSSTTHHPTITYESTLPPKPQTSTCDKRLSGVLRYSGPELNISVHDRSVFIGQPLILQGHVLGNPRPAVVWQHPRGHTLVDDGVNIYTHYGDDGTIHLQIRSISMQDTGIYECIATSAQGTVSQQITVQVKDSTDHHKLEQVRWSAKYRPNEYRELNEIARGRNSIVRQCIHISTGDVCAVKLISKKIISHERALHEYALVSSIRHDSIIRVFQFIETSSFSIIISELISGGRLFDYLCLQSILIEQNIAKYCRQLLDGVKYLHHCKIVHLDIQPENLLINTEYDQVKLCDFGDSIRLSHMKYVHRMSGNIEFAAPELIHGNIPVHYKTDIWSIGVILYTLLSGLSPFLDETDEQTCANIINIDFNFPESQFPYAFQAAKKLIQIIFVREPNNRPSASECLLNEWLHHAGQYQISTTNLNNFIERRKILSEKS
ncbi:unnamed protein product [Rotaria magnacalcarata]